MVVGPRERKDLLLHLFYSRLPMPMLPNEMSRLRTAYNLEGFAFSNVSEGTERS
jgi:hypothetical protein